jgi:hypothetical protein
MKAKMKIKVAKVRSETKKRGRVKFEVRPRSTTRGNEMGTKIKARFIIKSSSILCITIGPNI